MSDELRIAADLLRANGYAVVTQTEKTMWPQWLEESYSYTRAQHDVEQRLIWEVLTLQSQIELMLNGARPRWWRRHLAWFKRGGYNDPLVFGARGGNP